MIPGAFSIIIPYYNNRTLCEKLLLELIVQKKDFPQTEIIVVDDGSDDGAFLDELPGITVIHQENMGCPAARNTGLDHAQGEWITFCDCDDMVVEDYLKTIYRQMRKGFQWVSYDWVFNTGERSRQYTPGYRNNAVWAYTFRRELIGDKRFDTTIKDGSDDIDFVKRVIDFKVSHYECPKVIYIYYWYGNINSLQHRICRGEVI